MVSGPGSRSPRRLTAAVAALLLCAACASAATIEAGPTSGVEAFPSTAGTVVSMPTTTLPGATTTPIPSGTSAPVAPTMDTRLETLVPEGPGPFPAAVLVHGGGWTGGSPDLMAELARFLTDQGFLTVNAGYTLADGTAGFPAAVDDVACAVRHAAAHPEGDGTVAVIGHSAGAHLAALVALDPGVYGTGCTIEESLLPDRLVGLAGPYDVARIGPLLVPFFGVGPGEDPELWVSGNPLLQAANNPGLSTLIMHGGSDGLVDYSFAADFADALGEAGAQVVVEIVEGARHRDMHDPEFVGDLIITWLERG